MKEVWAALTVYQKLAVVGILALVVLVLTGAGTDIATVVDANR